MRKPVYLHLNPVTTHNLALNSIDMLYYVEEQKSMDTNSMDVVK